MISLLVSSALATALSGPPKPAPPPQPQSTFETLRGFNTVVVKHLNRVLGTENLPVDRGNPVEPGMLVTVTPQRAMVFDRNVATLDRGRPTGTASPNCKSRCAASLFDGFQRAWLNLAIEGSALRLEMPTRVLIGADAQLPARTLIEVAYAAGESRPVQPPTYYLMVNGRNAGLRALPFYLAPPAGLRVPTGAQPLGLTISFGKGQWTVTAVDSQFQRRLTAASLAQLKKFLKDIKRNYPSKEIVVLRPNEGATVADLVALSAAVRTYFPYPIFAGDQDISVR